MAENHKGFPQKGLQSAAHKVHTCSLKSIFSHAHVVRENDSIYSPSADGELCEAFSLWLGVLCYLLLNLPDDIAGRNIQRLCDFEKGIEGGTPQSTLNFAVMGAVQTGQTTEDLL